MAFSEADTQLYANYDKAVVDFIHNNLKWPPVLDLQKPLLCVFATPERAFAQVEKRLPEISDGVQKKYPLVFCSIDRLSDDYDPERDSRAGLRRFGLTEDRSKYYNMSWPLPVTLLYQVTIWSRQLRDLDGLATQLRMLFTRPGAMSYIEVDHPFPMCKRIVPIREAESRRLPMIEAADQQRVLRREVSLELTGWLIRAPEEVGIVEKVTTEIYDSDDLETLGDELDTFSVTEGV